MSQTQYQAEWYQKNKEHCKLKTYKWRSENPDYNKDYYQRSRDKFKQRYLDNREEVLVRSKLHHANLAQNFPEKILYRAAKARAKERGLDFNIQISDIIIPEFCPVFGFKLEKAIGKGRQQYNSPSLDRFDNTKGYIKGNIYVISSRANSLKSDSSLEELKTIIAWMEKINVSRP